MWYVYLLWVVADGQASEDRFDRAAEQAVLACEVVSRSQCTITFWAVGVMVCVAQLLVWLHRHGQVLISVTLSPVTPRPHRPVVTFKLTTNYRTFDSSQQCDAYLHPLTTFVGHFTKCTTRPQSRNHSNVCRFVHSFNCLYLYFHCIFTGVAFAFNDTFIEFGYCPQAT